MTVKELNKKLESYVNRGYGNCELKTVDQGNNDGEVLGVFDYSDPNADGEGSTVVIEIA